MSFAGRLRSVRSRLPPFSQSSRRSYETADEAAFAARTNRRNAILIPMGIVGLFLLYQIQVREIYNYSLMKEIEENMNELKKETRELLGPRTEGEAK